MSKMKKRGFVLVEAILLVIILFFGLGKGLEYIFEPFNIRWYFFNIIESSIIVILGILYLKYRGFLDLINIEKLTSEDWNYLIIGLTLIFSTYLMLVVLFVHILEIKVGEHVSSGSMVNNMFLAIVFAAIIAPIVEEFIFRGTVQNIIEEKINNTFLAVFSTSIFFALMHIPIVNSSNIISIIPYLFIAFTVSIVLGYTYVYSRNLSTPIILHALYNFVLIISLFLREKVGLQEKILELISSFF